MSSIVSASSRKLGLMKDLVDSNVFNKEKYKVKVDNLF